MCVSVDVHLLPQQSLFVRGRGACLESEDGIAGVRDVILIMAFPAQPRRNS